MQRLHQRFTWERTHCFNHWELNSLPAQCKKCGMWNVCIIPMMWRWRQADPWASQSCLMGELQNPGRETEKKKKVCTYCVPDALSKDANLVNLSALLPSWKLKWHHQLINSHWWQLPTPRSLETGHHAGLYFVGTFSGTAMFHFFFMMCRQSYPGLCFWIYLFTDH